MTIQDCSELDKAIVVKVAELKASKSYLLRNTAITFIREFGYDPELCYFMEANLLSILVSLVKDTVPNIKMSCAIVLKKLMKQVKSKDSTLEIKGALEALKKEKDQDVINAIND